MIKNLGYRKIFEEITNRFKPEELFFGITMIATVIIEINKIVPPLSMLLLLAFYYFFFGWFIFRIERKINFIFSIVSGFTYAICLISLAFVVMGGFYTMFFYIIQVIILSAYFFYLTNVKRIEMYKLNHYIRIGIILFLNLYVYIIK